MIHGIDTEMTKAAHLGRWAVVGLAAGLAVAAVLWVVVPRPVEVVAVADPYGDRSLLADGSAQTSTGTRWSVTDSLRGFDRTVRIGPRNEGLVLDTTPVTCHDGRATVTWHVGNLEPTVPDTIIYLTARLDEAAIGTIIKGSTRGIYDDGPVDLRAVVDCPAGPHTFDLLVSHVSGGGWGIPYVVTPGQPTREGVRVLRGFIVEEVYEPTSR